jgi:putative inorganic carbon (hco3(-)) transporter
MKQEKEVMNKFNDVFIIIFLLCSLIGEILIYYHLLSYLMYSYCLVVFGLIAFLIYLFNKFIKKERLNVFDFLIFILILCGLNATIFAIRRDISIWGFYNRYEGLFSIITYYTLFLVASEINDKKMIFKIIYIILFMGLINLVYGLLEVVSYWSKWYYINDNLYYANGLLKNSNFFSTMMVINYGLSLGLLFINNKKCDYILIFLFTIGIFISGCLGGILTILFIIFLFLIINIIKKHKNKKNFNFKKILISFIILILSYIISSSFIPALNYDFKTFYKDSNDIKNNAISSKTASSRLFIWGNTIKIVPQNIVNGIGIDNFYYAFDGHYLTNGYEIFDKVHNEYLQLLITEGLVAFISYLVLISYILLRNIYLSKSEIYLPLLIAFGGYLFQSFFNISIIKIAPIFYIIMGLLTRKNESIKNEK